MQNTPILRLYPPSEPINSLSGLYLAQNIRSIAGPFVYTNFVTSLDGRISQANAVTGINDVPSVISNTHDLLLFGELAAQADVLVTTSRHLRAIIQGRQDSLVTLSPQLEKWRISQDLPPQPLIAVVGERLDLALHLLDQKLKSRLLIVTTKHASQSQIQKIAAEDVPIVFAENGPHITGKNLVTTLCSRGLNFIYSIAGPGVFQALLVDKVLHRLYLTISPFMLSGVLNEGLLRGPALSPPQGFTLQELYFDQQLPLKTGQFFAVFNCTY